MLMMLKRKPIVNTSKRSWRSMCCKLHHLPISPYRQNFVTDFTVKKQQSGTIVLGEISLLAAPENSWFSQNKQLGGGGNAFIGFSYYELNS